MEIWVGGSSDSWGPEPAAPAAYGGSDTHLRKRRQMTGAEATILTLSAVASPLSGHGALHSQDQVEAWILGSTGSFSGDISLKQIS